MKSIEHATIQNIKRSNKDLQNILKILEIEKEDERRVELFKTVKKIIEYQNKQIIDCIEALQTPPSILSVEELAPWLPED